jgi:hypothetical protein
MKWGEEVKETKQSTPTPSPLKKRAFFGEDYSVEETKAAIPSAPALSARRNASAPAPASSTVAPIPVAPAAAAVEPRVNLALSSMSTSVNVKSKVDTWMKLAKRKGTLANIVVGFA